MPVSRAFPLLRLLSAYVSIRQHVSIRQQTAAYGSIRQELCGVLSLCSVLSSCMSRAGLGGGEGVSATELKHVVYHLTKPLKLKACPATELMHVGYPLN